MNETVKEVCTGWKSQYNKKVIEIICQEFNATEQEIFDRIGQTCKTCLFCENCHYIKE